MKKLLLINSTANSGSTGRIAEEIGQIAIANGYESYFAYGRIARESKSHLIRIGNDMDIKMHGLESRLFDNHCFASKNATKQFIKEIERIEPDIVNIHNIHGYYANIEILVNYLSTVNIPIVWTLHDCWTFTGHCSYFDEINCERWKTHCYHCPNKRTYPASLFIDASKRNFDKKKVLFNKVKDITFVTPSQWLCDLLKDSFLSTYPTKVINNGVNMDVFHSSHCDETRIKLKISENEKVILGVASIWSKRKGLKDFVKLNESFKKDRIVLVGLNDEQIASLPEGVIGIKRTESVKELVELYSMADVFVNPTYSDNFPTTNIEALACGTPVVTYKTGGSPETVDERTGIVVEQGNIQLLAESINTIINGDRSKYRKDCRRRAENFYNMHDRFNDYVNLFDLLINK